MEHYSIKEVIEQAIQTEELGQYFYTNMAQKFHEDNELKQLFDTLARKEIEHETAFIAMMDSIQRPEEKIEGWDEVSLYMRAIVESEFFLGKHKVLPKMDLVRTVKDAVSFALGFEKETLLYFIGLRDMVDQKNTVDAIIKEEQSHIKWLSAFKRKMSH
jgi:rubrerythrin